MGKPLLTQFSVRSGRAGLGVGFLSPGVWLLQTLPPLGWRSTVVPAGGGRSDRLDSSRSGLPDDACPPAGPT